MEKRQLTKEEKEICKKAIHRFTNRNKRLIYLKHYDELLLNEGLKSDYEESIKRYEEDSKNISKELELNKNQIEILINQIKTGVEVKRPIGSG